MKALSIGHVARRTGIGVETVRFYERQGLIQEPARRKSGYRQYTEAVIPRLEFIKRSRELGFSLQDIGEFLSLRPDSEASCDEVKRRAEEKIAQLEEKIGTLVRMKGALEDLVETCCGKGSESECPFLEALAEQDASGPEKELQERGEA